jgi:hypothetical protein
MRRATILSVRLGLLAALAFVAAVVLQAERAAPAADAVKKPGRRTCAIKTPSEAHLSLIHAKTVKFFEANADWVAEDVQIVVPVLFHVIHDGDSGKVKESQLDDQIKALNDAYGKNHITFQKKGFDYTDNAQWATMDYGSAEERAAKTALGKDPQKQLNFYTATLPFPLLGWATFPFDLAGDPVRDGVVVFHTSLPGGEAPYDQGKTGVHEVGHWLGLYHTFQGGCEDPDGDFVDDTPAHKGPIFGKPDEKTEKGCKEGEWAPIHNYMNYTDDAWRTEVTPGQIKRIRAQVGQYRPLIVHPDARARLKK